MADWPPPGERALAVSVPNWSGSLKGCTPSCINGRTTVADCGKDLRLWIPGFRLWPLALELLLRLLRFPLRCWRERVDGAEQVVHFRIGQLDRGDARPGVGAWRLR